MKPIPNFEEETNSEIAFEDIIAVDRSGKRITARIRIGAPFYMKKFERWGIRSEIMDVDYADGPFWGSTSLDAMYWAVKWIEGRMEVLKDKHGYKFYYPDSEKEYVFNLQKST